LYHQALVLVGMPVVVTIEAVPPVQETPPAPEITTVHQPMRQPFLLPQHVRVPTTRQAVVTREETVILLVLMSKTRRQPGIRVPIAVGAPSREDTCASIGRITRQPLR